MCVCEGVGGARREAIVMLSVCVGGGGGGGGGVGGSMTDETAEDWPSSRAIPTPILDCLHQAIE